jgi:hypothetical protein
MLKTQRWSLKFILSKFTVTRVGKIKIFIISILRVYKYMYVTKKSNWSNMFYTHFMLVSVTFEAISLAQTLNKGWFSVTAAVAFSKACELTV